MDIQTQALIQSTVDKINIVIGMSGYVKTDETWHGEKVTSPFCRLYFVEEGEGILESTDGVITMRSGFVYLIPVGTEFSFRSDTYVKKLYFHINVYREDYSDYTARFGHIGSMFVGTERIKRLIKAYFGTKFSDAFMLKREIFGIVFEISDRFEIKDDEIKKYSEAIEGTMEYIKENLSARITPRELAERVFMSESGFSKRFKREVGVTVKKYIDNMLFFEAEKLMSSGNITLGRISERLGFCDQFYFSRRFKERYGETPSSYMSRRRHEFNGLNESERL